MHRSEEALSLQLQAGIKKVAGFRAPPLRPLRRRIVPAVLFLVAFATVVAISNRNRLLSLARTAVERSASAPNVLPEARASVARVAQVPTSAGPAAPAAATAHPAPRKAAPTAEQVKVIDDLKQSVSARTEEGGAMEEREARGNAIREVGNLSAPQATQALISALRNDSDLRNRILAVEGLRRAAVAGDEDGAIHEALREASTSANEVIAEHAREAYNALAK